MARLGRRQPNRPTIVRPANRRPPHGSGVIGRSITLVAEATPGRFGSGQIGTPVRLSYTAHKKTGIGLPPRPRTRWQLVVGPASGGHSLGLTKATGRRYTAKLTEASELAFNYNGRHPEAAALDELATDVHVLWSPVDGPTRILDRLRVGPTQDILDPASSGPAHQVQFTGLDYRYILSRRRLYSGAPLTYTATDQAEIAWALVNYTQGLPGGYLGISKGWAGSAPTGVNTDATFEARDSVGEKIDQLSQVVGGFDWDITPISASSLSMDVWYPERGVDRGVLLVHGGLAAKVQRTVNPDNYANALAYTGAAGDDTTPGPTPKELADPDIGNLPQGRWDAVFGDDSLSTQAALDARATWQLGQSEVLQPVYVVTLKRGAWGGPDHIWLGDPVRLIVKSGRLDVDTTQRVYEVEISFTQSGGEVVVLTLGGQRPSYKRKAAEILRRLSKLEHR
ncbi:hypothetical protein [Actinomadura nitritigenes]|uniref:hypothetical protein n=1 Tax=Actinomadura nitritigenes TaxID=134602 RepID=UPI003D917438